MLRGKRKCVMAASNEHLPTARRALAVFLSLKGQARAAILEMDVALLHSDDGIDKLIEKLDTLFLEDKNQSPFVRYENFGSYHRVAERTDFNCSSKL